MKTPIFRLGVLVLVLFGFTRAVLSNPCVPAPSGLVGWWRAEGDALDSADGNNGALLNGAGFASGEVGQAFVFNGFSSSVRVPASAGLDVGLGDGLTMEVWINPLDFSFQEICEWNHNGSYDPRFGGGQIGAHLELNEYRADGSLWGNLIDTSGNAHAFNTSGGVIATNTWQHVALTYDKASGVAVLYRDGVAVATANLGTFTPQTSSDFFMGCRPAGPFAGLYFNGKMDEVSVYSRALSAAEIQAICNAGTAGKCNPTIPSGVPAITSVTPATAVPGANVLVSGLNFSPLPVSNIVFFGAVRADVLSASATNLVVTVPTGATFAPITVNVGGRVASAPYPFAPTFPGSSSGFDATSFAPRFDLAGADGAHRSAMADLDGDGSPDIAVANAYGHTISLFRNLGAGGSLSVGSFAPRVDLPAEGGSGDNPYGLVTADVDGDGKLDLVACDRIGNHVSVYRNLASPGSLTTGSFALHVNFPVGGDPRHARVADLDGDGRPDIISANYAASTISILRNVGVAGALDTSSFAPAVNLPAGTGAFDVAIADLDGDGKPDLAVVNQDGYSMSLYRNLGAAGGITTNSFAPRVDLPAPNGSDTIVAGDVDGDGKLDLVIGSYQAGTMSVYRNQSSPGLLVTNSFAGRVDFYTGNWTHNVALSDLNGDARVDIVTVGEIPSYLSVFQNLSTPGSFTNTSLAPRVDYAAGWNGWGVSVGDLNGDSRPDVVFCNAYDDTVSVYQNVMPFGPPPPTSNCVPAPSGQVSWWAAEGNALDSVGENDGVLTGGMTFTNGEVGQAFNFNGIDGRIVVSNTPSLNFGSNQDFSIEAWIRPLPSATDFDVMSVVDKRLAPNLTQCLGYELNLDGGRIHCRLSDSLSGNGRALGPAGPELRDGNFHHVALTLARNSITGGKLFVDGQVVLTFDTTGLGDLSNSEPFRIGNHASSFYNAFFKGQIDEVSLYNRALSEAEIQSVYSAGSAGKCAPTGTSGVPLITSFTPSSAVPGASVTISGLNFSPMAASNIVYFGAVRAVVTAASATSLTVSAPAGATYAPITVTVNGLTACGDAPFLPTFSGAGTIDTSSLAPRLDLPAPDGPGWVVIADLDGDGKPDMAVDSGASHTISIYRNISTTGSLEAGSFAPRVDLLLGTGGENTMVAADVDGDGKLDLVFVDRDLNRLMILRNLCTPGSITAGSFAAPVSLPVGPDPRGVAVRDLDGDGKPEVIVASWGDSTVSVFRNIGTMGSLTTNSFAPAVTFATGPNPQNVMVADLDGDGQPDLATVNNNYTSSAGALSLLRNVGSLGNISFAAHVDFSGRLTSYSMAISDLDGDGKPDLVIGSQPNGQAASVYRNISTAGSITTNSFAPGVDFDAGGWANAVAIGDLDGDGKPDLAVATQLPSHLSLFKNVSTAGSFTTSSFAARVDFPAGWNANGIAVGDLDGDGRPDVVFANTYDASLSIYQNVVPPGPPPLPTNCVNAPSGLVGWWPGEGDARDRIGMNNGAPLNVAFTGGLVGQAFYFNGTNAYIEIADSPALKPASVTVEAWVRLDVLETPNANLPGQQYIVFKKNTRTGNFEGYTLNKNRMSGQDNFCFSIASSAGQQVNAVSTTVPQVGVWYHLAGTYDSSSGYVKLYVNGVEESSAYAGFPLDYGTRPVFVGTSGEWWDGKLEGTLDEVSIYSRALSAAEIQAIYNAGAAGKCPPPPPNNCVPAPSELVAWWPAEGNGDDVAGGHLAWIPPGVGFTNGVVGQAFSFDGSAVRVLVSNAPALNFGSNQNFSIEAWIRPLPATTTYGVMSIVDKRFEDYNVGESPGYEFSLENGQLHTRFLYTGFGPAGPDLRDGYFHHVALAVERNSVTGGKLFVDGVVVLTFDPTGQAGDLSNTEPLRIGNHCNAAFNSFFKGEIDEVSIYRRALSAAEIQVIYNAGSAGKCPLPPPPVITSQPVDQSVNAGGTATFSVGAQGTPPLYYQWFLGASPITGQTGSELVLTNVQPAAAGYYSVVVSNAHGAVTSSNALLTVLTYPPAITSQPKSATIYQGSNATFSVTATGTAPLSYQWFLNGNPLVGRIGSTLVLTNVQPGEAGRYSVTITNLYGTAVSSNAVLTVLPPPVCIPPPSGIVAWWRFESNTVDSVGVNDLIFWQQLYPSASPFVPGKAGSAFVFTGNFLRASAADELNVGVGVGLTIEGWIRPNAYAGMQSLVAWGDDRGYIGAGLRLNAGGRLGVIGASFTDTNVSPIRIVEFESALPTITNLVWQHVALTFDRLTGLATIYVNGAAAARTNLGTFTPLTQVPLWFGCNGRSLEYRYRGAMDEMSLYNRALTAVEIQSICRADYAGKCPPPPPLCAPVPPGIVAWWQGQSNMIDVINGYTGAISNAVTYTNGAVGASFQFSGGSIRVPAADNLNVGAGPGLTIELWLNPTRPVPLPVPLVAEDEVAVVNPPWPFTLLIPFVEWQSGAGTQGVFLASVGDTTRVGAAIRLDLVDTQGISHVIQSPSRLITGGAWQHVAVAYDALSGLATLYFNGTQVARTNLGIFTPRTTGDFCMALPHNTGPIGNPLRFTGMMDEVSVYGRALGAGEIRSLVMARGAGKCAEPPTIVEQPQSLVANPGDTAVFNVTAEGTPKLHYQWYFNSNSIAGATDPTLTLTNVQYAQAGNYWVVVTNYFGLAVSSNAVLRVNHPPVANAGATPPLVISCNDSNASAVLDGSRSSDPDGDSLRYLWFVNGSTTASATGVVAVVVLPMGTNTIMLRVNDGLAESDQTIAVEVITAARAVERLMAQVIANVPRPRPLLATLSAALASIQRGNDLAATFILQAFQHQVRAQVAPRDPVLAARLIGDAQDIIDALKRCWCRHGHWPGHGHEQITPRVRHDHGRMHLEFPAARGQRYLIEASSDLVHWEKIGVAKDRQDDTFEFEDAKAGQSPMRFYRVVEP